MADSDMSGSEARQRASWGIGIALGTSIGVAMGVALDNMGMGIALGVAIGVVFAAVFGAAGRGTSDADTGAPGADDLTAGGLDARSDDDGLVEGPNDGPDDSAR